MTAAQFWVFVLLTIAPLTICAVVYLLEARTDLDAALRSLLPGEDE